MSLFKLTAVTITALLAAGCATDLGKSIAEEKPGSFVTYTCEKNKSFSARFSAETGTVRIRTMEGSVELSKGSRGLYRDETGNWVLTLGEGSKSELIHKGKATHTNCTANS